MIDSFCSRHFICLNIGSDRVVLNRNDVSSILVVSTKKRYSSFLEKVFVFQKICFKVKVLKTFQTFNGCHRKKKPIPQTEGYFESPLYRFSEEPMLFLLALK